MVVSLPGFPDFRPSFYEGDNSTEMWTMLAFAQRNYPDFPKNLSELSAFDFDYVPPTLGTAVIVPAAIMLFLSVVIVGLRLWTRYKRKSHGLAGLGMDDWLIVAATIGATMYAVVEVLLVRYGCVGRHCYDCVYSSMVFGYKYEYVSFVVYLFTILFTKLSILSFTWKLAAKTDRVFRAVMVVTALFILGSTLVTFFMVTFNCNPVSSAWDYIVRTNTQYACFSMQKIIVGWSVVMAVTDLWLLVLPSQLIWRLHLPTHSKLGLTFIFSLGIFATIASFVKAQAAVRAYHTYDLTWHFVPILIGSHLEITLGLIAASLPALNTLIGRTVPTSWESLRSWASKYSKGRFSLYSSRKEGKSLGYSTANTVTETPGKPEIQVTSTMASDSFPAGKAITLPTVETECVGGDSEFSAETDDPPRYEAEILPKKILHGTRASSMSQISVDLVIQNPSEEVLAEPNRSYRRENWDPIS